jgi:hypothetical protein
LLITCLTKSRGKTLLEPIFDPLMILTVDSLWSSL